MTGAHTLFIYSRHNCACFYWSDNTQYLSTHIAQLIIIIIAWLALEWTFLFPRVNSIQTAHSSAEMYPAACQADADMYFVSIEQHIEHTHVLI